MSWTSEQDEVLTDLAAKKYSASEIAAVLSEQFSVPVSRNAVIGRCNRKAIKLQRTRSNPRPIQRRAQATTEPKPKRSPVRLPPTREVVHMNDLLIPVEQRVDIMGLTNRNCHWPVGDPLTEDFFFCGGEAESGCPYCTAHASVAFAPTPNIPRSFRDNVRKAA